MKNTDILVIGAGLAGATAAITAADMGRHVTIISKTSDLVSGNTPYAQGGIIYKGQNDSPEKLKKDILEAGAGHCWEPAVDQLCEMGPRLVKELLIDRFEVEFDKNKDDELDLTEEGAHSQPRIIHSQDRTGEFIQKAVVKCLEKHPNIEILLEHTAVDLLTLSHHSANSLDIYKKPACFGAFILDNKTKKVFPVFAGSTILATGGLGQIYLHTTNPKEATGDGIALAWRAGARVFNLQFVQFHPTTLYSQHGRFLISESMRGEGAKLIDKHGNEFMHKYHEQGSLAPRDIVSRGIHETMFETDHSCVYLDISHKDSEWLKQRFPAINAHCLKAGIDITSEPIPVVPAAHYACGGVGVSLPGRTSLQRLYAVGEVSCTGVHGANRLASTSLLENLVWGFTAGRNSAEKADINGYYPEIFPWKEEKEYVDPALLAQDWLNIKNTMWNYVGLVRTQQRLYRAQTKLRHLQTEVEQFYRKAEMSRAMIELRNGVQTAIALTNQAVETRFNIGTHYLHE